MRVFIMFICVYSLCQVKKPIVSECLQMTGNCIAIVNKNKTTWNEVWNWEIFNFIKSQIKQNVIFFCSISYWNVMEMQIVCRLYDIKCKKKKKVWWYYGLYTHYIQLLLCNNCICGMMVVSWTFKVAHNNSIVVLMPVILKGGWKLLASHRAPLTRLLVWLNMW